MTRSTAPAMPMTIEDATPAQRLAALRRGVASGQRRVQHHVDPIAAGMLDALQDALGTGDLSKLATEIGIVQRGGKSRDMDRALDDRDFLIRTLRREMGLRDKPESAPAQIAQRLKRYSPCFFSD